MDARHSPASGAMPGPSPRWRTARHRLVRWLAALVACSAVLAAPALGARTEPPGPAAPSGSDPQLEVLRQAVSSVVGLRIEAAEDASSAESLGRRRAGSGVVIGPDGLILTIGYLLLEAQSVEVVTAEGRRLPARVLGHDLATGFGLVMPVVPLRGMKPVRLAPSSALPAGESVLAAIGPGGETGGGVGLTQLIARRPFSGYWEYHIDPALFTSPPVPEHSGAALFNRRGELIGIGSLFTMEAGTPGEVLPGNMFVPVELLAPVLAELRASGTTRASQRPWLGLSSSERGGRVQILRVNRESPAERAGLREGDVVLEVDGARVATLEAFYKQLWAHAGPEPELELTVLQGAEIRKIRLRAGDRTRSLRKPGGI